MTASANTIERSLLHVLNRADPDAANLTPIKSAIRRSWLRSAEAGLTPDEIHAPYDSDVDSDGRLQWAAAPSMCDVAADLPDLPIALLLTDAHAHVIDRWTLTPRVAIQMDGIGAAAGFICAESIVGTNSIGLALHLSAAAVVRGNEHFADALTTVSCASRPITDPSSGQVLGIANMTCVDKSYSPIAQALVGRIAHETEQRLLDESGATATALHHAFVQARRTTRAPIVALDSQLFYANEAAAAFVTSDDHIPMWRWAEHRIRLGPDDAPGPDLASGPHPARCEPIYNGASIAGAIIWFDVEKRSEAPLVAAYWSDLSPSERTVADHVATGLTNRETAAALFISPHTVDFHLRQIYRKLELSSRVELARLVEQVSR